MADVRDAFVIYNQWGKYRPCPKCLPNVNMMIHKPPKRRDGCIEIVAKRISTGKYIWSCNKCRYEEER